MRRGKPEKWGTRSDEEARRWVSKPVGDVASLSFKDKARISTEMYANGFTIRQIAIAIDANNNTVAGWIFPRPKSQWPQMRQEEQQLRREIIAQDDMRSCAEIMRRFGVSRATANQDVKAVFGNARGKWMTETKAAYTSIRLTVEQYDAIKSLAMDRHCSTGEVIRQMIESGLAALENGSANHA